MDFASVTSQASLTFLSLSLHINNKEQNGIEAGNTEKTAKKFAMDFSYFIEETIDTKICNIYRNFFSLTAII